MLPESIDQAKELLYGHELATFVAERDVLVKQIRGGGDRDLANAVKALRKPSRIAADVNEIVRADPAGIDLILQAAALLRSAQTGALEGSTIDASQLQQHYRAAIRALSQSATSRQAEVRAALEAATIDESSNDALRAGCLVVVPTPVSLFGNAPTLVQAPSPTSAEPDSAVPEPAPVDELEARRARRRSSKAKEQATADEHAATTAAAAKQAEAAAEKKRAAEAEAQRKRDEKERLRKLKALKKTHREAVRSHLAALDAEEAAGADVEEADQTLVDIDEELQALEQAIADLQVRRIEATQSRSLAADAKTQANKRAEHAEAEVDALADAISALEDV